MFFVLTTIDEVVRLHAHIEKTAAVFETRQYGDLFSNVAYFKEIGQPWEKYVTIVVIVEDRVYISRQKFTAPGLGNIIPHESNFEYQESNF